MEKNLAALLREGTRTIRVKFFGTSDYLPKEYTYVSDDASINEGDLVIVLTPIGEYKVVLVSGIDPELNIEPNSGTKYKWVVARLDLEAYNKLAESNQELERIVREAYRSNVQRNFAATLLASLPAEAAAKVQAAIGGSKNG